MHSCVKLNIVATCIFVCSFTSVTKAQTVQLASSKPLNEIYNKKINEKLAIKNKSANTNTSLQKEKNLPSANPSLKNVANSKIKKTRIITHNNLGETDEEKKNKLASNSPKLKEIGATIKNKNRTKFRTLPLH